MILPPWDELDHSLLSFVLGVACGLMLAISVTTVAKLIM